MAPPIATVDHNAIQYSDDGAVLAGSDRLQSPCFTIVIIHDIITINDTHPQCIVHCA
ncbi:Uncharacterised protein [Porphyromonas cangingivalis]|nr:Uncharacterised protein [Porphyromonas cangingivalis]